MSLSFDDTIAAVASPPGPAARGILRISGPDCLDVVRQIIVADVDWTSRSARRWEVSLPFSRGTSLTAALHLWPTSRSYTGQPAAELHLAGSVPLLNEVLRRVFAAGARPAQPGEFTLRAFLAGRIDLMQAEAVLGVIDASDPLELRTALGQLAGGISQPIAALHEELLLSLADLEAGLDFVEEDIEFISRDIFSQRLSQARSMVSDLLEQSRRRMTATGCPCVVLAGLPNAGKSTLFNALAQTSAALVSAQPGTTRDYLSLVMREAGRSWELVDTAGWEPPRDGIEAAAADLRDRQLRQAQLVIWCAAGDANVDEQVRNASWRAVAKEMGRPWLDIRTKSDLEEFHIGLHGEFAVSANSGAGLRELREEISRRLSTDAAGSGMIAATAARCSESLESAQQGLDQCLRLLADSSGEELLAMELRGVLEHLGRIAGRVSTDDILDRIFSRFCIGK